MRRHARLPALAAAAALLAVVPAPARAASCAHVVTKGSWKTIDLPVDNASVYPDPSGPGRFFALDPYLANASPQTLRQSTDGGCTWHVVFDMADRNTAMVNTDPTWYAHDADYAVAQVVVPDAGEAPAKQHVYLVLHDVWTNAFTPAAPEVVVVSADGGRSWVAHSPALADLEARGRACNAPADWYTQLVVAPSDPRVAYLLCVQVAITSGEEGYVYDETGSNPLWNRVTWFATTDSGATWSVASKVADGDVGVNTDYYYFQLIGAPAVDPQDPKSVWLAVGRNYPATGGFRYTINLKHSTDGAKTFKEVVSFDYPHGYKARFDGGVLVANRRRGGAPTIVAWTTVTGSTNEERTGWMGYSADGGRVWRQWDTDAMYGRDVVLTGVVAPVAAAPATVLGLVSRQDQVTCALPAQRAFSIDLRKGIVRVAPRDPPLAWPHLLVGPTANLRAARIPGRPAIVATAAAYPDEETCAAAAKSDPPVMPTPKHVLLQYTGRV